MISNRNSFLDGLPADIFNYMVCKGFLDNKDICKLSAIDKHHHQLVKKLFATHRLFADSLQDDAYKGSLNSLINDLEHFVKNLEIDNDVDKQCMKFNKFFFVLGSLMFCTGGGLAPWLYINSENNHESKRLGVFPKNDTRCLENSSSNFNSTHCELSFGPSYSGFLAVTILCGIAAAAFIITAIIAKSQCPDNRICESRAYKKSNIISESNKQLNAKLMHKVKDVLDGISKKYNDIIKWDIKMHWDTLVEVSSQERVTSYILNNLLKNLIADLKSLSEKIPNTNGNIIYSSPSTFFANNQNDSHVVNVNDTPPANNLRALANLLP